jgi:hypothetical protein
VQYEIDHHDAVVWRLEILSPIGIYKKMSVAFTIGHLLRLADNSGIFGFIAASQKAQHILPTIDYLAITGSRSDVRRARGCSW